MTSLCHDLIIIAFITSTMLYYPCICRRLSWMLCRYSEWALYFLFLFFFKIYFWESVEDGRLVPGCVHRGWWAARENWNFMYSSRKAVAWDVIRIINGNAGRYVYERERSFIFTLLSVLMLLTHLFQSWFWNLYTNLTSTCFNLPKPGLQSMAFCGDVCTLSIANSTLLNWPIVSLLILFILYYLVIFFVF